MSKSRQCLLCDGDIERPAHKEPNYIRIACPRCGDYVLWEDAYYALEDKLVKDRHVLSGYTRELNERENRVVEVRERDLESIRNMAPRGVQEKADRLLMTLARKSAYPGFEVPLTINVDYPLAYCENETEFNYYIQYLSDEYWINHRAPRVERLCQLTPTGWGRVNSLKKSNRESLKVFVAMSFKDEMTAAYKEGIEPAVEGCGYRTVRIDNEHFLGGIPDTIIAAIRESRFVVVDMTHHSPGTYFEGGFALGLGLPVIWCCHSEHLKEVHFDTSYYNHLRWETSAQLKERLQDRIRATIGLATGGQKSR